jgi:hypothetical protein
MTTNQAIAMCFPLLTALLVAATGYVVIKWIVPRPSDELIDKPSNELAAGAYKAKLLKSTLPKRAIRTRRPRIKTDI